MTSAKTERTPARLSPHELLTGELPALLSLWASNTTPEAALSILSVWAGLQRLTPGRSDPDEDRLTALVRQETSRLISASNEGVIFDVDGWLRRADDLDRAAEGGIDDSDELDWQAHELFEQVDRASLAIWALVKLGPEELGVDRLACARAAVEQADRHLAARADLFISLAADVGDVLSAAHLDLHEQDPELWASLLRHRRIEEARDELEAVPDRATLFASASSHPAGMIKPAGQAWLSPADPSSLLMLAAGTGLGEQTLVHRLATESPAETPTRHPNLAWAHFLAATYLDTGLQDAWRQAFLNLDVLSGEWRPRQDRARVLDQVRDWERRYAGEGVLALEPGRATLADLLALLRDLAADECD